MTRMDRRIMALVLTALLMVLSIYTCFIMLMDAKIYLKAEDIVEIDTFTELKEIDKSYNV